MLTIISFNFSIAKIYDFIWNEFCDWYIEIIKTRLYDKQAKTKKVEISYAYYYLF